MAKPPVKAQELADVIADQIRQGRYRPDEWLPSERRLAEMHEVGRSTVRQAIRILADAGLVKPAEGAGVQVIDTPGTRPAEPSEDLVVDAAAVFRELEVITAELRKISTALGVAGEGPVKDRSP